MTFSERRQVPLIIAIVILVNAVLLFSLPLLPFIDLPNHLAEATIYKYKDAPGTLIGQYYEAVPWYYPNTFHTVFCSLFPSVEAGNKTFYVLYILLLQLSVFGIIKTLKGNQWYGLLSILFIYNFNVIGGFTGFVIAIPVTLLLFYLILLDVERERFIYKILSAFLLVLLYLMHAQMALFGLLLYGAIMLYRHWGNFKTLIINCLLVTLPVVLMVVIWWLNRAAEAPGERSTASYLLSYYKKHYLGEFLLRFRLAVFDNFSLRDGWLGLALAGIFFSFIFLPLFYFKSLRQFKSKGFIRQEVIYPLIFLAISLGCYFILPSKLPGQAPLYERFSTVVILAVIITGSVLLKNILSRGLKYFVLSAAVLYTGLWVEYFYTFNKQNKDFDPAFFSGIPHHSKLGGLIYNYRYRGRYTYLHFPNYFIVWNKGIAASKIIDYRFGVVQRGAKGNEIPFYNEWIGRTYAVESSYDSTLHYLLVRGNAPVAPDSNLAKATLVSKAGAWQLYRTSKPQ